MGDGDQALVHRSLDGWLLGGLGIVAWLAVTDLPGPGGPLLGPLNGVTIAILLAFASAHFGASYHLAYGDGKASLRRHPLGLVWAPLALFVVLAAVVVMMMESNSIDTADWLLRALLILVFSTTGWHYIKQAYGVAMLSMRLRSIRPRPLEIRVLRYGFYPIWFVDLMDVWAQGNRATYRRYDVGIELLPRWVEQGARVLAGGCVIGVIGVLFVVSTRERRLPPMGAWAPYVAGGLWFVLPPSYISAAAVIGATHSVQYLTCVHRAEVNWGRERGERNMVHWWLCVFGGATAGGLLVATWLPDMINRATPDLPLPGVVGALFFVLLNLHHYAIDASMWRSGGQHVRRIVAGPQMNESVGAAPVWQSGGHDDRHRLGDGLPHAGAESQPARGA